MSTVLRRALTRRASLWRDLIITFAGVSVSTAIRLELGPEFGSRVLATCYFPAVMVAGAVAGTRAMLIALVTSSLIVWWAFTPAYNSFAFRTPQDVAALCAFVGASGLVGGFAAYLRGALIRLWEGEERQRLLIDELNHRVKNALATALALAQLTAPKSAEMQTFLTGFADRLNAIARANTILTQNASNSTELSTLLEVELGSLRESVAIHGPPLKLRAQVATSISMIVHELATNSMKYGALSGGGAIDVTWCARKGGGSPRAILTWVETGGRTVALPPERGAGFGLKLIARLAEKELGGSAELAFHPEGLHAEIEFPP